MEVRPDGPAVAAAFVPVRAVVAEPGHDASQRGRPVVQVGTSRVVLEAGDHAPPAGLEVALDQDVTDHPALSGDRMQRQQTDPGQLGARTLAVVAAE